MTVRTPEFIISYIDTAAGKIFRNTFSFIEANEHTDTFIMTHQEGKISHKSPKYIISQRTKVFSFPLLAIN